MTYGKLTNNQLITPQSISLGGGQFITNPTDAQFIAHGYKEVIDIQPTFDNYERSYTETDTQIIVNYVEVVAPEMTWHEQTNFQIKFTERNLRLMLGRVPDMVYYTNTLEDYDDMMGNVYFYVNNINDEELPLLKVYAEIYDKEGNRL